MNYAIVYSSQTGNTRRLAEHAREVLGEKGRGFVGAPSDEGCLEALRAADVVLLGSWTDKGSISAELASALPALVGKRVFLFGTCGFGGSKAYFSGVLDRFASALPEGAEVVGRFMCQGQMPPSVRERYVGMAEKDPGRFTPMIENFDRAVGHPDEGDLSAFSAALEAAGLA